MSKRKLTRRQQWRIDKIQGERRERADRKAAAVDSGDLGPEQNGLVVVHHGQQVTVEDTEGTLHRCHFRSNLDQLVVGDRVVWQPQKNGGIGVISALIPRDSVLKRPDPYGNLKPVAANIDLLAIVFSPLPAPSSDLLDRYLVAAELSGITPLLVLNKADLLDDTLRPWLDELSALYQPLGYRVIEASATSLHGLDTLREALAGHTSALVGQSGVGKSSLVNVLLPEVEQQIGPLSERSGLGQHTTVAARLFHLPGGGSLIDSPGIREFGLWHISEEQLLSGYRELAELAGHCKFRNCSHRHEPGCALHAAAEAGEISEERLDNFLRIADSLDEEGRKRY